MQPVDGGDWKTADPGADQKTVFENMSCVPDQQEHRHENNDACMLDQIVEKQIVEILKGQQGNKNAHYNSGVSHDFSRTYNNSRTWNLSLAPGHYSIVALQHKSVQTQPSPQSGFHLSPIKPGDRMFTIEAGINRLSADFVQRTKESAVIIWPIMQNNQNSTLLEEIVRGIKISAQLSALLMMAGCQGQSHESEQSIFDVISALHPVAQVQHLIGR